MAVYRRLHPVPGPGGPPQERDERPGARLGQGGHRGGARAAVLRLDRRFHLRLPLHLSGMDIIYIYIENNL